MASPGVGGSLSAASDVALDNPADNQVLKREGGYWKNLADTAGAGASVGLVVAANDAPAQAKASADYICDGNNDEVQINTAITQAAFSDNGGVNWGLVQLTGGEFNIEAPIKIRTGVHLQGAGYLTILKSVGMAADTAVIILNSIDEHMTKVSNMTLDGNWGAGGGSSAIWYRNSTGAFGDPKATVGNYTSRPGNSPDPSHVMSDLFVTSFATAANRHGIFMDADGRDPKVSRLRVRNCTGAGFKMNASSDGKYSQNIAIGCNVGWDVGGGSNMFTTCKAAYAEVDAWQISSSRAHLVGCHAQDAGRHGFNITSIDTTMNGCVSDSNRRLDSSGYGLVLAGSRAMIDGIHIYDRGQSAQQQINGIDFSGASDSYVTGHVRLASGSNYINGSPTGSSYARIVRVDSTMFTVS